VGVDSYEKTVRRSAISGRICLRVHLFGLCGEWQCPVRRVKDIYRSNHPRFGDAVSYSPKPKPEASRSRRGTGNGDQKQ